LINLGALKILTKNPRFSPSVKLKLSASLPSEINRKQVKVNVCRCDVLVVGEIPQHVEKCQLHMRLPGSPNLKNLSSQATGGKWGFGGLLFLVLLI